MTDIYRDPFEGATAKRQDLLRRRRDELVTMPHAIRRVVVARSARIAAATAIIVVGTALLAVAASPAAADRLATLLPGTPAVLATLLTATWIAGLAAYWIARARVEHRFAVAMSRYVLPGADLDHDLERLDHEHPDDAAREMAHRLEVRSAALPVLAATMVVPATGLYLVQLVHTRGWPLLSELEVNLAGHAGALVAIALAGVVAALVTTRRRARLPIIASIVGPIALGAYALAIAFAITGLHRAAWWLTAGFVCTGMVALGARRLRLERVLITADDPAAGSELFTLRGALRRLRATVVAIRGALTIANVRRLARRRATIAAIGLAGAAAIVGAIAHTSHAASTMAAPAAAAARAASPTVANVAVVHTGPESGALDTGYHVVRTADGRLRIDVVLDGKPVDVRGLAAVDVVRAGWRAKITVELTAPAAIAVTPILEQRAISLAAGTPAVFTIDGCDGLEHPIGLRVEPLDDAPAHYATLLVTPELSIARCEPHAPSTTAGSK